MLKGKFIAIGVTGSIACYKALELVSLLKKKGAEVQVVMTKSACEFISPLSFRVISQNPVITSMFAEPTNWEVGHVALADKAKLFLIAPATANIIAKIASGIADDMLTSTILATKSKKLIVPAMNVHMYENAITQKNIKFLKEMGFYIMEPDEGPLACGYTGKGRFPEPVKILETVEQLLSHKDLIGKKILITAGPTREPIDPIRFLSNRSTGKMGYALARQAVLRGADTILVSGPTHIKPPLGLKELVEVNTAEEMLKAVLEHFDKADIVIKAAAVADFSPKDVQEKKIKKTSADNMLVLKQNTDILKVLGSRKTKQILIGFAAETDNAEQNAKEKLIKKNLDFIILNDVSRSGAGFGTDTNIVTILGSNGQQIKLPLMSKSKVADKILDMAQSVFKDR